MGCGVSRYERQLVATTKRRPSLSPSVASSPLIGKCTVYIVTAQELRLTAKLFRDLSSRCGGETINKTTFLQFFQLPVTPSQGMWGERLFDKFDRYKSGRIDYDQFTMGLSVCIKGSEEEKLRLLFSLYDLSGDGFIDKRELLMMVHSTYRYTLRNSQNTEISIDPPEQVRSKSPISRKRSPKRPERHVSAALIHRDESMLPANIELLVEGIMKELHAADDHIGFEQFEKFVAEHPRIMEVFDCAFHQEIWTSRTMDQSVRARPNSLCLCGRKPADESLYGPKFSLEPPTVSLSEAKSGWLMEKTRAADYKKVYAVLRSSTLLLYPTPAAALASKVVFLEGCFIDSLSEFSQGKDHGFALTHQYEGFKPMSFWTSSKKERDSWVMKLQVAAKSRRLEDFYEVMERLGSGKFSDVYLAKERITDYKWAVKIIDKTRLNEAEKELLRSEIAILKLLNHPNVVEMKEVFEDKTKMYVVLELAEGGELFERIRQKRVFSEYMAYHVTKQLLETVKYLHEMGIVHRDIKPENILLSDNSDLPTIKLADFGLSKLVPPEDTLDVPCGTLGYVAPEVLMMRRYGKEVDMWSIGVVLYLMVRGRLPFDSKDKQTLIDKTIEAKLDFTGAYWTKLTIQGRDFLEKLLCKDGFVRLSSNQALAHSWIRNGEIVIPRKINRQAIQEDLMKTTLTSAKIHPKMYDERTKASTIIPGEEEELRLIYTTPDIYEDMKIERKGAEHRIQLG